MPRGMPERRRRGTSLATQVTVAGVGFGLLVAVVFGLLVHAVREQRDATRRTTAATDIVAAGNRLERLVIDTETGQRGFVISGDPRFLAPLDQARAQIPDDFARLRRLAAEDAATTRRLAELERAVAAYLRDWSDRVVAVARVDRPRARRLVSGGRASGASTRSAEPVRRAARRPAAGGRRPGRPRQRPRAHGDDPGHRRHRRVDPRVRRVRDLRRAGDPRPGAAHGRRRRSGSRAGDFDAARGGRRHAQAELGSMVRGFNAMADALEESHDELEAAARGELPDYAEELEAQRGELERTIAAARRREAPHRETRPSARRSRPRRGFAPLAHLILATASPTPSAADAGAIFVRDARRDDDLALATVARPRPDDLPEIA